MKLAWPRRVDIPPAYGATYLGAWRHRRRGRRRAVAFHD
jgi:hypothetical protein